MHFTQFTDSPVLSFLVLHGVALHGKWTLSSNSILFSISSAYFFVFKLSFFLDIRLYETIANYIAQLEIE